MPRAGLDPATVTEAAAAIVDVHGRGALTLARVAAEFGVASPSLYKHVAGLDDLVVRVSALSIRRLTDRLADAALGRSGNAALRAMATAYRAFAVEHAGLYPLTQGAPESTSAEQRAEAARALEILGALVRSYGVPATLSVHAIRLVRAALHGFVDIETRGGFRMAQSIDESFLLLVDGLDASLKLLRRKKKLRGHGAVLA